MIRALVVLTAASALFACGARSSQLPAVEMRFYETPNESAPKERIREKFNLNVALISDATLRYTRPTELLKAAETSGGGDPQKLMRAGRTLVPGEGIVLLGTVRAKQDSSGSATNLAVYSVTLHCGASDLSGPGDLKDCKGYVMRVTRSWPGEVYEIDQATVSVIPEGGTAYGRIRAKSTPGGFKAELEGDFAASIVNLEHGGNAGEASSGTGGSAPGY